MEKATRNAINAATQDARRLLEQEFLEQLTGTFDIMPDRPIPEQPGQHLSPTQRLERSKIIGAISYEISGGVSSAEAIHSYVRDAAFTTLNRMAALKMLESRGLVQECVSAGPASSGFVEFCGLAPGLALLPDDAGYRIYLESLFDELSTEVKVLFDRRDAASILWPRRKALLNLLELLNVPELQKVWSDDETIGWIYQYFNSKDERQKMRDESQAPRNSRELAVRNQFFTPRYVVEFLVDNTLGRTWMEMHPESHLSDSCDYYVELEDERPPRDPKDPRSIRILDPACGSGHFLLYAYDLLQVMYEEDWEAGDADDRLSLRYAYQTIGDLRAELPRLILEDNLHGIDIDPRCAQIAALALWMRAQRAWQELGLPAAERPRIRRTHIVVAEPMPGDAAMVDEFAGSLSPPLLGTLFTQMVSTMTLAGEMGYLLKAEKALAGEISKAREEFVAAQSRPLSLPGLGDDQPPGTADLTGIDDDTFFDRAEHLLLDALAGYAADGLGADGARRRLFVDDAGQGVALIDLLRTEFDVVLMNPPFGAGSLKAKKVFDRAYPKTKNDVYAAFVERGIELLVPRGMLGAITSRTGFFLSSFQKWREDIILETAPPLVFADLGQGVLDGAMVEVAAYCLESVS